MLNVYMNVKLPYCHLEPFSDQQLNGTGSLSNYKTVVYCICLVGFHVPLVISYPLASASPLLPKNK